MGQVTQMNMPQNNYTAMTVVFTGKPSQTGVVSLTITGLTTPVAFLSAMPDTAYTVTFEPVLAITGVCGVSAKTITGFTVLSLAVASDVKWKAVGD